MGEKETGTGTSAFDSEGAVGKEFTKDGSVSFFFPFLRSCFL